MSRNVAVVWTTRCDMRQGEYRENRNAMRRGEKGRKGKRREGKGMEGKKEEENAVYYLGAIVGAKRREE